MAVLYRYTNLAAAIHLLQTRKITLLNPATWDDQNDSYYMAEYKRYRKARTVLALCFTKESETYHHWRVFSAGTDGVRIELEREALLAAFKGKSGTRTADVRYRLIKDLGKKSQIRVEELPFLKRRPYAAEKEFRIIYESKSATEEFKDYTIKLAWIRRITLSPWMSLPLARSVRDHLRSIDGCDKLKIARSTLVNNETWKSFTANVKT